jgi:antitoxin CptB
MHDPAMSQLRWRCRRGMRELDVLLVNYLEQHYQLAPPNIRATFKKLLSMQDPEILALLTGRADTDDPLLHELIQQLLPGD